MNGQPPVLITAFEPFGNDDANASAVALDHLPEKEGRILIRKALLPTSFARAWLALEQAIRTSNPGIVLLMGQAGGRPRLSLERRAVNVQDAAIPDNDGAMPQLLPIIPDGPGEYRTALPLERICAALNGEHIAAEISVDAGRFVCNATYFRLLHYCALRSEGAVQAGFIHLPWLPDQAAKAKSADSMDPSLAAKAVMLILRLLCETPIETR